MLTIKKIMYKPPATIVFWNDGTKTVSVCEEGDLYNKELGFALCVLKKKYDNKTVHAMLDKYVHNVNKYSEKDKAFIWEGDKPKKKEFRKPNIIKKRVRVHRKPDKYLELTLEPTELETEFETMSDEIYYVLNELFR